MKPPIRFILFGLSMIQTSKSMEKVIIDTPADSHNSIELSKNQLPSDPKELKEAVLLSRKIQGLISEENNELKEENKKLQEKLNQLKNGNKTLVAHLKKLTQQTTQRSQYTTTLETENKDLQAAIKYLQMLMFNTDMLQEQSNMAQSLKQLVAIQSEQLAFAKHKWEEKQLFLRASLSLNLLNSGYREGFFGPDENIKKLANEQIDAFCVYARECQARKQHPSTPPINIISIKKVPAAPHNTPNTEEYDNDLYVDEYPDLEQTLLLDNIV